MPVSLAWKDAGVNPSTAKLPFKIPSKKASNSDHKALNRGTLEGCWYLHLTAQLQGLITKLWLRLCGSNRLKDRSKTNQKTSPQQIGPIVSIAALVACSDRPKLLTPSFLKLPVNSGMCLKFVTRIPTSTPQLPLQEPQIPSHEDHKALNRGTLGGLGIYGLRTIP